VWGGGRVDLRPPLAFFFVKKKKERKGKKDWGGEKM